ncbi:WXG100 family type VII secretion target [Streptomyces violaceorubidus]|uniref:WXG100 family type VII secretion target n=1 Tax=Streptomyces violaceorubidus TaxID=284042 RepID=A0ABV1SVQ8_9ACTN
MGEPDLTVDYEFLADCERKLGQLKKTFEDIESRRDDMKEHWGSGAVAGAMEDFVDNWDDYRTKLVESIGSVGKLVAGSKKAFEDLDEQLAKKDKKKQKK